MKTNLEILSKDYSDGALNSSHPPREDSDAESDTERPQRDLRDIDDDLSKEEHEQNLAERVSYHQTHNEEDEGNEGNGGNGGNGGNQRIRWDEEDEGHGENETTGYDLRDDCMEDGYKKRGEDDEAQDAEYRGNQDDYHSPFPGTRISEVSSTRVESLPRSRRGSDKASSVGSERSSSPPLPSKSMSDPFSHFMKTSQKTIGGRKSTMTDAYLKEKQNVLMDIERLKMQGIQFSKQYTVDDPIEDMQYEIRRHMLHMEEMNNMNMMRDGMRMLCTGIEMLNGKFKLMELNGWSQDVCSDMTKYDTALSKIYRKYWRKSHSVAPELEVAMGVLTSAGMYHFKKKISKHVLSSKLPPSFDMGNARPATRRSASPSISSEDGSESPPP